MPGREGDRGGRKLKRFIAILRIFFCTRKCLLLVNSGGVYHVEPKSMTFVLKITYSTPQGHLIIFLTPFFSLSIFLKNFYNFKETPAACVLLLFGVQICNTDFFFFPFLIGCNYENKNLKSTLISNTY